MWLPPDTEHMILFSGFEGYPFFSGDVSSFFLSVIVHYNLAFYVAFRVETSFSQSDFQTMLVLDFF